MRSRKLLLALVLLCSPAWADYRSSTTNTGNSFTPNTTVPAGAATDDIMILSCTAETQAPIFTGHWPAGFTQFYDVNLTLDGQSAGLAWKRLTAPDTGSYTLTDFSSSVNVPWICQAFAFSGRDTINPPVATSATNNSSNASPVTVSATGVTALQGDDLLWVSAPDVNTTVAGIGHTPPASFTERQDVTGNFIDLSGATQDNVSAGATGTISGTFTMTSGAAGWAAGLVQIPSGFVEGPPPPNAQDGSRLH